MKKKDPIYHKNPVNFYIEGVPVSLEECIDYLQQFKKQKNYNKKCIEYFQIWLYDINYETGKKTAWQEPFDKIVYGDKYNKFQKWKESNGKGNLRHTSKKNEMALIEWIETFK